MARLFIDLPARSTFQVSATFGFVLALLAASPAPASCVGAAYGQASPTYGYHYVHLPPFAMGTPASVLGRFWSLGVHSTANETCDDSVWFVACNPATDPCGGGSAGRVFYINGNFDGGACDDGCNDASDSILLLEDRSENSPTGYFALGRVPPTPSLPLLFDYSAAGRDWTLVEFPRPRILNSSHGAQGSIELTLAFDDPAAGFFGLPGASAADTITAIELYAVPLVSGQPAPGCNRADWTFARRYPYVGGQTTGTYSFNPGFYSTWVLAAALELDRGQFVTDYVSRSTLVQWDADSFPGAGRVPDRSLRVSQAEGGDLTLSWGSSDCAGTDFEIFEGTMGTYYSHAARYCSTGGESAWTLTPSDGNVYYLVVPTVPGGPGPDTIYEGSYGRSRDGSERPAGPGCFVTQRLAWCP